MLLLVYLLCVFESLDGMSFFIVLLESARSDYWLLPLILLLGKALIVVMVVTFKLPDVVAAHMMWMVETVFSAYFPIFEFPRWRYI